MTVTRLNCLNRHAHRGYVGQLTVLRTVGQAIPSDYQHFDAHCCHMKHAVPDRVKPSFVIFDIWTL